MQRHTHTAEIETDRRFVGHARTFAGLTLISRIAGLARDALFARAFGASPIMSAWFTAFVIPNVFRRLFGEGALAAAFIPEYTQLVKHDPRNADRLASLVVAIVFVGLSVAVLFVELLLGLLLLTPLRDTGGTVLIYTMVMLPYAPLICSAALLGGMLQTHGKFGPTAAAPIILNGCLILSASIWAFGLGAGLFTSILAVSVSVLIAGAIQLAWCLRALRTHVVWTRRFDGARDSARRMIRRMGPVLIGMGTLQLSTMIDALLAGWANIFGPTLPFSGDAAYPLDTQAASVLWYAQRLYQFPLGVFGIAIATAVFPALARAADNEESFLDILRRGIRLSLFIGLPASIGLIAVRTDLTAAIYRGGAFGEPEVARVGAVLLAYAPAVWAYSLSHVFTRAFYAKGDTALPMRIGLLTVALNIALNLTLMWPLREAGLALATTLAAAAQCGALAWLAHRRFGGPGESPIGLFDTSTLRGIARIIALSLGMALGLITLIWVIGRIETPGFFGTLLRLGALCAGGAAFYLGAAWGLCCPELRWMLARRS